MVCFDVLKHADVFPNKPYKRLLHYKQSKEIGVGLGLPVSEGFKRDHEVVMEVAVAAALAPFGEFALPFCHGCAGKSDGLCMCDA